MADSYERKWRIFGNASVDINLPTVNPVLIVAKSPLRTIRIQRIAYFPTVFILGVLSFIDSATGIAIFNIQIPDGPYSGGQNSILPIDCGVNGIPLTKGANLLLSVSGPGTAGQLHIDAYQSGSPSIVTPTLSPWQQVPQINSV